MANNLKLYSYDIGGTPVAYLDTWNESDLNGKTPFIIATGTTDNDYVDVTSDALDIVDKYGETFCDDYQHKQKIIRLFHYEKGWDVLTDAEKDLVVKYYANPQLDPTGDTQTIQVITHLMTTKNLSIDEATDEVVDRWHNYWENVVIEAPVRWRKAVKVAVKYLSFVDATDLLNTIENLVAYYLNSGRLGLGYGDSKDGILNYITSTNSFVGTGLRFNAYTLKKGSWDELEEKLVDEFVDKQVWDRIIELTNTI